MSVRTDQDGRGYVWLWTKAVGHRPLFGDERRTIEGLIWRLRNRARWRSLPAGFGP